MKIEAFSPLVDLYSPDGMMECAMHAVRHSMQTRDCTALPHNLGMYLTEDQRAMLAVSALQACSEGWAEAICQGWVANCHDPAPLDQKPLSAAREWAVWASEDELDAYALAAFERMSERRKKAFKRYLQKGE